LSRIATTPGSHGSVCNRSGLEGVVGRVLDLGHEDQVLSVPLSRGLLFIVEP